MGLFDLFRGKGDALRDQLFDAAARGNAEALEAFCRENADAVEAAFPAWTKVPSELRRDPARVAAYAQGLMAVARCLAERLGRKGPLVRLVGTPETNPVLRWQEALRTAKKAKDDALYAEAADLIAPVIDEMRRLAGTGVTSLLPIALGWLGECRFQTGNAAAALGPMEEARRLCEQAGDEQGARAYLANCVEILRYLGRGAEAAACLEALADRLPAEEADATRRRAARLRAGEPLLRVTVLHEKREYEIDELPRIPQGKIEVLLRRNRITLHPTGLAIERGREAGAHGNYLKALEEFDAAGRSDPYDPDPPYLAGLALMHLDRYMEAIPRFELAERLAPGWIHVRSDLWMARELATGRLDRGTFLAVRVAEDGAIPPEKKLELLDGALSKAPRVALLHLLRGEQLVQLGRPPDAASAFRAGLALEADPDTRTRLLLSAALALPPDAPERAELLRQAVSVNGNLTAAAMATLALRRESTLGDVERDGTSVPRKSVVR